MAEQQARPPRANHAPTPEHPCGGKGKPKNVLMCNCCPRGEAGTGRRALPRGVGPSRGGTGGIFQPRPRQLVATQKGPRARCLPRSVPRGLPSPLLPHLSATMAFLTRQMFVLASPIVSCGTKARRHAGAKSTRNNTAESRSGVSGLYCCRPVVPRKTCRSGEREPGRGATSDGRHRSRYIHTVLEVA